MLIWQILQIYLFVQQNPKLPKIFWKNPTFLKKNTQNLLKIQKTYSMSIFSLLFRCFWEALPFAPLTDGIIPSILRDSPPRTVLGSDVPLHLFSQDAFSFVF